MAEYLEYTFLVSSIRFRVVEHFPRVWPGEVVEYLS